MRYNFVAGSFHTNKLCSRLSSSNLRFLLENGHFAFLETWEQRMLFILGSLESA